ncbi:MAG TPA: hypothetical protein VHK47_03255 [Polyangia bacterium]|jgi:hypothetical protein|nr:hypothetical protein [Polyangia bacterium]
MAKSDEKTSVLPALAGPLAAVPAELQGLLEQPVILHLATRNAAMEPMSVMAFGLERVGDGRELTVFLAAVVATETLANLRDNGQIALTLVRPTTHLAIQIKGTWLGERRTDEADRAYLARYRETTVEELGRVGVPRSVWERVVWWPVVALRMDVREVFVQTPGAGAGRRCGETGTAQ